MSAFARSIRVRQLALLVVLFAPFQEWSLAQEAMHAWRHRFDGAGLSVGINPLNPNTVVAEEFDGHLSITYDGGATWQPWSTVGLSRIRQIIIHPADTMTVFCAASGPALWKSTNFGLSWEVSLDNLGIDGESIAFDPLRPDTMYAGNFSDGSVFRSTDRGTSWTYMGNTGPPGTSNLCALAVRPDSANIVLAGSGGGRISKSTDFGASWRIVKNGTAPANIFQETPRIVVHPLVPMIAYATTYGDVDSTLDVWKSSDGGEHWSQTALRATPTWSLELDPLDADVVYAGSFTGASATVYKSTDGGDSWSSFGTGFDAGGYMWNMKIHPLDPSVVWMSVTIGAFGPNGLYRSLSTSTVVEGHLIESGSADTIARGTVRMTSTNDAAEVTPAGRKFRFGYFEGDPSVSPTVRVEAYPYVPIDVQIAFVPDSIVQQDIILGRLAAYAVGGRLVDSVTQQPVRAAVRLFVQRSIGDTLFSDSTDANGEFQFAGCYASAPPVNSYERLQFDGPPPYATAMISPVALTTSDLHFDVAMKNADVFLVAASDSGAYLNYYLSALNALHLTSNTWDVLRSGPVPLRKGSEFLAKTVIFYTGDLAAPLAAQMLDSLTAGLDAGSNLFLTGQNLAEFNGGSSLFSSYLGVGFAGNTPLAFNQGVSGEILQGFTCFTTGSGANNQTSRDSLVPLRQGVHRILDYSVGTGRAAAVRIDSAGPGGARAVMMGFGFEAIHTPAKREALLQAVINYFRGVTAVGGPGDPAIPSQFLLEQNYPNPFNPNTTFRFQLRHSATVTLRIFDVTGREVATPLDRRMEPGSYDAPWSAQGVASGVYFCRFLALDPSTGAVLFSQVRKLVLLQ